MNAITWDFDKELGNTLPYVVPEEVPPGRVYVPPCLRKKLITWTHTVVGTGHPRTKRTHELSKEMLSDNNKYMSLCSSCAQAKVPNHFPVGKLQPLPNPPWAPWSHLALVFLTDFPKSKGNAVIVVVLHQVFLPAALI